MMLMVLCLVLLALDLTVGLAGPYDLKMDKVGECEDTGKHEMIIDVTSKYKNKTTLSLKGHAVLPYGISDKIQVIVHGGPYDSGKMEEIFVKNFGGVCTAIKLYAPDIARIIFKAFDYSGMECPKKGNYSFDFHLPFKFAGLPILPYGKFRFHGDIFLTGTTSKIGCLFGIADILPKKYGRKHSGRQLTGLN